MIKLFRNIRKNLLSEGKTGKYFKYAIGEIVLVVIGILIALQINNWNETRKNRNTEQKILNILKSEFTYNQQELERNILKATSLKNRADSILNMISDTNRVPDTRISKLVNSLSGYSTFDPSNGGLDNLLNSGQLELIQNDLLKIKLSKWYGEVQDVKEDEVRLMNFGDTYITPLRLKYTNARPYSVHVRNETALLDNPEFENIIFRFSNGVNYIIENYLVLNTEIQSIIVTINSQIEHD